MQSNMQHPLKFQTLAKKVSPALCASLLALLPIGASAEPGFGPEVDSYCQTQGRPNPGIGFNCATCHSTGQNSGSDANTQQASWYKRGQLDNYCPAPPVILPPVVVEPPIVVEPPVTGPTPGQDDERDHDDDDNRDHDDDDERDHDGDDHDMDDDDDLLGNSMMKENREEHHKERRKNSRRGHDDD